MTLTVREEQPSERDAVFTVNRLAFGQEEEARLVDALRACPEAQPTHSLIAVDNDRIVGHILFSAIMIETPTGAVDSLALAPMAVLPDCQKRGIGSQLVCKGLETCRDQGHKSVVVLGHPKYYPRFGFAPARSYGIRPRFDVPDEAFMVLELEPGALTGVNGVVRYTPPFEIA